MDTGTKQSFRPKELGKTMSLTAGLDPLRSRQSCHKGIAGNGKKEKKKQVQNTTQSVHWVCVGVIKSQAKKTKREKKDRTHQELASNDPCRSSNP